MEGGGDVMPLDLYEHMVTEDASGGASPGVSSTSNQAFLMDNWVHQLYEQVLFPTLLPSPTPCNLVLNILPCRLPLDFSPCLLPNIFCQPSLQNRSATIPYQTL